MNRRTLLMITGAALLARPLQAATCGFEICRSESEWRERLSEREYLVLRQEETERPYTSPLNDEYRAGTYRCRGCDLPVYGADAKYDSGTGWPSFFESLPNAVGTKEDRKFIFQAQPHRTCTDGGYKEHKANPRCSDHSLRAVRTDEIRDVAAVRLSCNLAQIARKCIIGRMKNNQRTAAILSAMPESFRPWSHVRLPVLSLEFGSVLVRYEYCRAVEL
ncbi:peptide-methionine (R)-S-oxide reductase (plasmid) [Leisingera sp. NJS204]|nr:peptide-methionine (R)-S-oxide reductase [Leisingera sp. NJS204]